MAEYQLTTPDDNGFVLRTADQAHIPNDPANRDWQDYQTWLTEGGVPDPYVPPEQKPSPPAPGDVVLYDHENRLRAIEGKPPLSLVDFQKTLKGK